MLGIGIDTSIASAEEVENAIKQQKEPPKSTPRPIKVSADFEKEIDTIGTPKALDDFVHLKRAAIKKMDIDEQKKLRQYIDQIRPILVKSQEAKKVPGELPD